MHKCVLKMDVSHAMNHISSVDIKSLHYKNEYRSYDKQVKIFLNYVLQTFLRRKVTHIHTSAETPCERSHRTSKPASSVAI